MLLTCNDIHKSFGEVTVLRGISFTLAKGQVLGLVGENGAGKSTLMNILSGLLPPTRGTLTLDGKPFQPLSPRAAQEAGIAFIHQELNLFTNLSVAENLLLQNLPQKRRLGLRFLDRNEATDRAQQLLDQVGLAIAPDTPLERLGPAQQQLVEVAKALGSQPRIIIFDEPTTSLTRHEVQHLFHLIQRLQTEGMAMIYISHNLEDVMHLADTIAVLRDGELVAQYMQQSEYQRSMIVSKMVGRSVNQLFPEHPPRVPQEPLLRVDHLQAGQRVRDVSFVVKKREILGFYGLVGAGRSETIRMVYGLDDYPSGDVFWKDQPLTRPTPRYWISQGVGFLTEDRREEGLLLAQNIEKNVRLASLPKFAHGLLRILNFSEARTSATQQAKATRIKHHSLTQQPVATLSGGNQQKVVLSKWLMTQPELLILDEPTKGIDIGAKHEIYLLIQQLADEGAGVLLISSEIEELMGLCDRILVMSQGQITAEYTRTAFDRSAMLEAALHGNSADVTHETDP